MGTSKFYKLSLYFASWTQIKFLLLNPSLYQGKMGGKKSKIRCIYILYIAKCFHTFPDDVFYCFHDGPFLSTCMTIMPLPKQVMLPSSGLLYSILLKNGISLVSNSAIE